ncbi:MAG: glycosyltransferase [Algoriphagus sp.]|uniref:glycosyltransferase n=1 Tax=Algoriphagus sp. TaxID=1872435 RepID=UPI0027329AB8|nr:glycosyltransferase [Algoriphagus sp.]MDP3200392.1 glycosyltransferase [Algoriphagus sp.]
MKILFTQDALINAGAEKSHLEIISRFSAETEASLVYFYPRHDLRESYQRAGIRLFFLDIPESYHFPLAISRLVRLIRLEKPDLIVSCLWRADIITRIASLLTGVPLVGTLVNDSYSPISWTDKVGLKYRLVYWLDRLTSSIPVHWIANAKSIAKSHIKTLGIKEENISVVYRGRPVIGSGAKQSQWKYKSSNEETASSPRRIAVTPRSIRKFISYGRLLERKGFQDAIRAFSELVKSYPDCTLTILGEGPFRLDLEALIIKLGLENQVKLPGQLSDPTALLPTAHCFLFPSWYEGFSGSLIEAMMAGIPIIASDIPMNLEAIQDQESAFVFPVADPRALADQMLFAIQNPEKMFELGRKAREVAIQNFDIEVIAKQYERRLIEIFSLQKSV